jgi:hypothetical protein
MRVVNVRKGVSKFYGCVHSFISLLDRRTGTAEFHVVSTPDKLKDLDAQNVNQVVTRDIPLLENVPYRGGLHIQLGLFSVQSANLVAPYLNLLESLSNAAGVGIVQTALAFAGPIKAGIDLLVGAIAMELEVGLNTAPPKLRTETYLLMRDRKREINLSELRVKENRELEDATGTLITDSPYLVVTIEASETRPDWFEIPNIKKAHDDLVRTIENGKLKEAEQEAFPYFRRVCLTSPDLLFEHAKNLAAQEQHKMREVLRPMQTRSKRIQTWSLQELNPFNA